MTAPTSYDGFLAAAAVAGGKQKRFFYKVLPAAHVAQKYHSSWGCSGSPAAGAWMTGASATPVTTNVDSSTPGAFPLVSPTFASGKIPSLVAIGASQDTGATAMAGHIILIDRLADLGSIATVIGTGVVTFPGGLARYADGEDVMASVEILGGTPSLSTVQISKYTNQDGTANRVGIVSETLTATPLHRFVGSTGGMWLGLAAGDRGIRSIEEITIGAVNAANFSIVLYKVIDSIPCSLVGGWVERDFVIQTPDAIQLPVNTSDRSSCLQWVFVPNAATTSGAVFSGKLLAVTA